MPAGCLTRSSPSPRSSKRWDNSIILSKTWFGSPNIDAALIEGDVLQLENGVGAGRRWTNNQKQKE